MDRLPFSKIAFVTGLALSSVAAWYSIIGLTALFSGAFWPIVMMGSVLEIGKVVASAWLFRNWTFAPGWMKTYLSSAVVVLMMITSLGIFGFLSKAHLEHQTQITQASSTMMVLDTRLTQAQTTLASNQKILQQLIRRWEEAEVEKSYEILRTQRRERAAVGKAITEAQQEIIEVQRQRQPLLQGVQKIEAEVGPIKYVAEFLYGDQAASKLGAAVRAVIIAIVFVFDPVAILLLLASTITPLRSTQEAVAKPTIDSTKQRPTKSLSSESSTSNLQHRVKGPRYR